MSDGPLIDTGGGVGIGGNANAGQDLTGRDAARTSSRGGDNYFGPAGNQDQEIAKLWSQVAIHSSQILDLLIKLDDIPNRLRYLERTEVIIRPGSDEPIVVRPAPESMTIPIRLVLVALSLGFSVVLGIVIYLVLRQGG